MNSIVIRRDLFLVDGLVLSPSQIRQFWQFVKRSSRPDDCWIWQGDRSPSGHGTFQYSGEAEAPRWAHRIAFSLSAMIQVPKGMVVRHTCGLACCCNPAHLIIGTAAENRQDYRMHRAMAARLTEADRIVIRLSRAGIVPLARRFQVANGIIWDIKFGKPGRRKCKPAQSMQSMAA